MKQKLFFVMILLLSIMGIRAQSNCPAPTGLNTLLHTPNWNNVQLSWNPVIDTTAIDILWSTRSLSAQIGLDGPGDFSGVVRFEPSDLVDVTGLSLTSVTFIPHEPQTICTYYVKVWQGGSIINDTTFNPGTLLTEQEVTTAMQMDVLNTILLNTPIVIDPTQELWIGIRCNTTAGFPLGASNNDVVTNKGELITMDSIWSTLAASALEYNWTIIGTLSDPNNAVSGYNLYKDDVMVNTSVLTSTHFLDSVPTGTYEYGVTAVYGNGCESDAISATIVMTDYPCANCNDSIIVGTGTAQNYQLPLNTYYNYSYTQQIYTAAEIGNTIGGINCISFQYIHSSLQTKDIEVYLGNTTKTTFNSSSDWVSISDMQLVYNGTINFTPGMADNWVTIPFNTPFEWDGVSNIVVAVVNNTGSYLNSDPSFRYHIATGNTTLYTYQDGASYNPENQTPTGTTSTNRNNIRFLIGDPITCRMPNALSVSNITSEGATINWTGHDTDSGYEVVCVPSGNHVSSGTPISVTDTFYILTGYVDNTDYDVYVRANCSPDNSNWAMTSFRTECLPIEQLPYVEDFDTYGTGNSAYPNCWKKNTTSSYPYINNTQHASGSGSLYFYSYSNNHSAAILPSISSELYPINTLQVSFKVLKTSASYGHIEVGVITDPTDISTFTPVKSIDGSLLESTNTWYEFTTYFSNYQGEPGRIAFLSPETYSSFAYIDDVVVEVISGCGTPINFAASQITGSSAYLSWNVSDLVDPSTTYNIEYSEQGLDNWQTATPMGTNCLLSNLQQGTAYEAILYASCDNGYSDTISISFFTRCLAGGEVTIGNGTNTNSYIPANSFYNYSFSQQLYTATEIGSSNIIRGLKFHIETATSQNRNWDIYLGNETATSLTGYTSVASHTKVFSGSVSLANEGWLEITFDSTFIYTGGSIVVSVDDNTGSYSSSTYFSGHSGTSYSIYNDGTNYNPNSPGTLTLRTFRNNIIFVGDCDSTASCIVPNLVIGNITPNTAELLWAPGYQETEWELEYKLSADSIWISEGTQNQNTYTLSNLLAGSEYDVRLRSVCNPGEYSSYNTRSFATPCEPLATLPLVENFDSTDVNTIPNCWDKLSTYPDGNYPKTSTTYSTTSGGKSLQMNNGGSSFYSIATTPRLADEIEMDSLIISFYTYGTSTSYTLEVGIMNDPSDALSFTTIGTIQPIVADTWERQEFYTRSYNGNGHHIAFRAPFGSSNNIYLDEININAIPTCPHVENLAVTNIDDSNVTLTWSPGSSESVWEVVILPAGPVDWDTVTNINYVYSNTYTESNLQSTTEYSAYVRANCDAGDISDWERIDFTTTQIPAQLPYICDFEMSNPEWGFYNNSGNNKWHIGTATNNGGTKSMYISNDNGATNAYGTSYTNNWAYRDIFFPASTNGYIISFDWKATAESCCDYMNVFIGNVVEITNANCSNYSSGFNGTTKLNSSNMNQQSTFTNFNYTLPGYDTDGVRRLYFSWHNDGSVQNNPPAAVDNIMISEITCPIPSNLAATNITTTAADLSWTENGTATEWIVYYKISTDSIWTETTVYSTNYQLTGLTPEMSYSVRVASDCGNGTDISPLSNTIFFTTLPTCPAPSNLTSTNSTSTTIDLTWTAGGTETAWIVAYKTLSDDWSSATEDNVTTTTHTITGISNSNTYQIRVKAVCDINDESSWSNIIELVPGAINMPTSGNLSITTCNAIIFDDGGINEYYSSNCSGSVTINPENPGEFVVISGNYNTEDDYDEIYVYDGTTTNGTLLNVYTGMGSILDTSITGSITIKLLSDGSINYPGFNITTSCSTVGAGGGANTDPCDTPTNVQVNAASNSANVSWTSTESAWIVEYKLATASNWTASPTLTTTTYNITGLTASTNYVVRVKSVCDASNESDWSAEIPFTTLAGDVTTYTITATATGPGSITPSGTVTVQEGTDITFSFTANEGATTQQLLVDNIETAIPTNNEYTFSSVVANHTIEVVFAEETGIEEVDLDATVLLFPNPATSHIEIRLSNDLLINSTLDIYDVYGRKIATQMMNNTSAKVDISGYSTGMYLVRISNDNGVVVKNFIKK